MENIKQQFKDQKLWFAVALGFGLGLVIFFVSLWLLLTTIMETDIITNIFYWPELFFATLSLVSGVVGGAVSSFIYRKNYWLTIIASVLLVLLFSVFDAMILIIVGIIIGYLSWDRKSVLAEEKSENSDDFIRKGEEEKANNLEKLRKYIGGHEQITNDDVQNLLNISDATAVRYLDELESAGLIKQIGPTGQSVYYIQAK